MPTTMNDREHAFEAKFAHDEEFRFLVGARRDKLFAHWAADRLALPEAEAAALVSTMLHIPDRAGHDQAMLDRVAAVLAQHGATAAPHELSEALARCAAQARQQLLDAPLAHPGTP